MSATNTCRVYFPFNACTGQGDCLVDGSCQCRQGWSSIGDFSTKFGEHCSIHTLTITIQWILAIIPLPVLFFVSLRLARKNYNKIKLSSSSYQDVTAMGNKKSIQSPWTEPLVLFPILFALSAVFGVALCALKIADPAKFAIALHPASSILFFLYSTFSMSGASVYSFIVIKFMAGYAKMMPTGAGNAIKKQSESVKYFTKLTICLLPFVCFIPVINVINPNHDRETMIAFCVAQIVCALFLGYWLLLYLHIISKELKKHLENNKSDVVKNTANYEKFISVKKKIDKLFMFMAVSLLQMMTVFFAFIFWPFMSMSSSYFFPMLVMSTGAGSIVMDNSVSNDTEKSSSSDSNQITTSLKNNNAMSNNAIIPIRSSNSIDLSNPSAPSSKNAAVDSRRLDDSDNHAAIQDL